MKSYCTQNDGDCKSCSLSNYGRDCYNQSLESLPGQDLRMDREIRRKYNAAIITLVKSGFYKQGD